MSLYERDSIPEGSYIHFQGHLLFPGSLMCLSLQNVCGAQMGASDRISNYNLQREPGEDAVVGTECAIIHKIYKSANCVSWKT